MIYLINIKSTSAESAEAESCSQFWALYSEDEEDPESPVAPNEQTSPENQTSAQNSIDHFEWGDGVTARCVKEEVELFSSFLEDFRLFLVQLDDLGFFLDDFNQLPLPR